MNASTSFFLDQSGKPFSIQNHLVAASSLTAIYTITGAPATLTVVIEGMKNASGVAAIVDSYVGTANTTRTITLSDTFDWFRLTATWTGGKNVSVAASLTSTGPGPTWSASSLVAFQNRPF